MHWARSSRVMAALLAGLLLASTVSGVSSARSRAAAADPSVVTYWNAVAVGVIATDAKKGAAEAIYWLAIAQAAVYNAVNGITGRYDLYKWNAHAPHGASPQAAAAAAAYDVLLAYFPDSKARLDAARLESLALVPNGRAKDQGVAFGQRAAARIVKLRANDGRFAPIEFTQAPAPGVWRPTLPLFAKMFDPWLSQLRPFTLKKPTQFRPGKPPALGSARYARDFNEVKDLGSKGSVHRSALQKETALFFSDIAIGGLQAALRDLVTRRHMSISKSARLLAAVNFSVADGTIAIWDSKVHFGLWRPITAIQLADTDGNANTDRDLGWEPLIPTPPYPDYASGLSAVMGAVGRALTRVLGTSRIDLYISSTAAGVTRHYEWASQLNRDVIDARVWSGIHFRFADTVGNRMGKSVADWALDHYFQSQ
jgi:hypothetical protein